MAAFMPCTDAEILEALEAGKSQRQIAKELKCNRRRVRRLSETHNASHQLDPNNLPANYPIRGTSNLHRYSLSDGEEGVVLSWVKTHFKDSQIIEQTRQIAAEISKEIPRLEPTFVKQPSQDKDLIPWFQIGDGHIGMLAYDKEIGESFDLQIAESELLCAFDLMVQRAPKTNRCVIQDVGDMTHYENLEGRTEASGHDLDCDNRFSKMIKVYSRIMRHMVERARGKYENVDVIINQGNHSRKNDLWMNVHLKALYEDEPRVNILDNDSVFTPYRMGLTFVMCHHFDKCKPAQLAAVMANDFAHDWGETKYHYVDGGHVHSNHQRTEANGVVSESFNQIAAADKYAHDGGWRSRKCLTVVMRSKTYGETGRLTVSAEEVKDKILKLKPGQTARKRREVYTV